MFYYIKQAFPDAENRYEFDGTELDIFIPSTKTAVEYDGSYFHSMSGAEDRENRKDIFCKTILYLVLIHFFGFYIATVVFMVAVLLFLRVKPIATLLSVAVIMALIYFAFQKFLGVRLPVGEVIKALR